MAVSKGITIEFNGEDKGLKSVMKHLRDEAKGFDKELRQIDSSLKFNPNNPKLLGQKLEVLSEAADNGEKRIKDLNDALEQMKAKGIDETNDEYRELEREIIKAEDAQKKYNKELKNVKGAMSPLGKLSKKMEDLGNKAIAAGEAMKPFSAAGAAVDIALAGIAYTAGASADDINTLSKVTGIGTGELQKYKAASDLVDVSVETIAKSQTKLKKSMYQASQGFDTLTVAEDGTVQDGNAMMEAFDKLGVSVVDSNGQLRDQEAVFQDTIGALGKMTNETERDALAMQIFGKSATELNPLIEDSGETYKMVSDMFAQNGLQVADQETLDNANKFNDEIDKIKTMGAVAIQNMGMSLAGYLAPALEKVTEFVGTIAGWLSSLSPQVLVVIGAIAGVVAAIAPLLILFGKISLAISSITGLMSTMGVTFGAIAGPIGIAIAAIAAIIAIGVLLYKNWDTIKAKAIEIKNKVVAEWQALKNGVVQFATALKTGVVNMWNALKERVSAIVTGIKDKVLGLWTSIKTGIQNIAIAVTVWTFEKFASLKNGIVGTFTSIRDGVVQRFTSLKDKVKSIVDAVKAFVKERFETIKYNITHPIEHAKDLITGFITRIKNLFSGLKLQLPHFKLPHFNISGGKVPWGIGGMGVKPTISVDWYKNGGIFTRPTLLGGMNGVGEAGAEAVLPLERLWNEMDKRYSGVTINVYAAEGMDVKALAAEVERRLIASQNRRKQAWA